MVTRHPVNLEGLARIHQRDLVRVDAYVKSARETTRNLYSLFLVSKGESLAGGVLCPDAPDTVRALLLAAQAGAGLFIFQRIEDPPRPFLLGDGPPVTYTTPVAPDYADVLTWTRAFYLTIVTRQADLTNELCRVTEDTLRGSGLILKGPVDTEYRFTELLKQVWHGPEFTRGALFHQVVADMEAAAGQRTKGGKYVRAITVPHLRVLRQLGERNADGFAAALEEAIQQHKKYWSSTEQLRKEFDGFVSMKLTAAAALAWDRGLRFQVESDYLPWSWVTGELFQGPAAPRSSLGSVG